MGTAVLLGIPQGYIETAKSAIRRNVSLFNGWEIKFVPSHGKAPGILPRDLGRVEEFAHRHEDIHILGFSGDKNRRALSDKVVPFFRFRWFRHELLRYLGSPDPRPFVKELAANLSEETLWGVLVKPTDLGSPLLLPECAFKPSNKHRDLWRHALAYGDEQNVRGAQTAILAFRGAHHRKVDCSSFSKYTWLDEGDRIFDKDGPRHGISLYPRSWKYSFKLEPGFHFDVTHLRDHQFWLKDINGVSNAAKAGAHLNIDPHGHVRG